MKKLYNSSSVAAIAAAIREKNGSQNKYKIGDMAQAVLDIPTGGEPEELKVTRNGTYTSPIGFSPVNVNVLAEGHSNFGNHIGEDGKWHRPEEWDDIESIDITDKHEIYLLYQCHNSGVAFMRIRPYGGGTLSWSFGHVVNGEYAYHSTCSGETNFSSGAYISKYLEDLEDDYIVIRLKSTSYFTSCATAAWVADSNIDYALAANMNTLLMRYGRIYRGNTLSCLSYFLESDHLIDFGVYYQNSTTTMSFASSYANNFRLQRWKMSGQTDISKLKVTSFASMFSACYSLVDVPEPFDCTGWVSSKTTTFASMFSNCRSLRGEIIVKDWDMTAITTLSSVFYAMYSISKITGIETWNAAPKVTTAATMFYADYSLESPIDLSNLHLGNGTASFTTTAQMFYQCLKVPSINISNMNLSKVTTVSQMFYYTCGLNELIMDNLTPISEVCTTVASLFGYTGLKEIILDGWNFSKATSVNQIFYYCYGLEKISMPNCIGPTVNFADGTSTSNALHRYCYNLEYSDMSWYDLSVCTGTAHHLYGFRDCYKLKEFYPPKNIKKNFNLSSNYSLSHDSLVRIIEALEPVTATTTLTIGAYNLYKLTDEEKKIATDKGWTLA